MDNIIITLLALATKNIAVLGMDFATIAALIPGANTTTVGEAFDTLVANGSITAEMIADGVALQAEIYTQTCIIAREAALHADARRIANATGMARSQALAELRS